MARPVSADTPSMPRRPLRALVAVLSVCAAAVASSCGSGPVNPLALVAAKTSGTNGAKMDVRVDMTMPGMGQVSLTGIGAMNLAGNQGTLSMRSAQPLPGLGSNLQMDEVIDRKVIFMRIRGLPQAMLGDKPWIKLDMEKLASGAGIDLGALQTAGSSNPAETLRWLKAADDVKKLGSEVVRGTRTDHYRAVIDVSKVADKLPASQRAAARVAIEQLRKLGAPERIPTQVWVGADGLLRRQALTFQQTVPGTTQQLTMRMVMDLHDYGAPVHIRRPNPRDVLDITKYASSAMNKLGG